MVELKSIIFFYFQGMRTQDQWWCSGGENPHCSLTKSSRALTLCMPGMLGKSSHHEKNNVSATPFFSSSLFSTNKYPYSLFLSPFKNVISPPLAQCLKESYLYFGWLPWIESCWGQGIPWTKRESDDPGLIIPLTAERGDLVMYCSQILAHFRGMFWKEKERWGVFFVVVQTQFFSWLELLPNMPGMQSLKALLLLVKEQCFFSRHYTIINVVSPSLILSRSPGKEKETNISRRLVLGSSFGKKPLTKTQTSQSI